MRLNTRKTGLQVLGRIPRTRISSSILLNNEQPKCRFSTSIRRQGLLSNVGDFLLQNPLTVFGNENAYSATIIMTGIASFTLSRVFALAVYGRGRNYYLHHQQHGLAIPLEKMITSYVKYRSLEKLAHIIPFPTGLLVINEAVKRSSRVTPPTTATTTTTTTTATMPTETGEFLSSSNIDLENIVQEPVLNTLSMANESFLWIPSLVELDKTWLLPIIVGFLSYSNARIEPIMKMPGVQVKVFRKDTSNDQDHDQSPNEKGRSRDGQQEAEGEGQWKSKTINLFNPSTLLPSFLALGFSAASPAAVGLYWASYSSSKYLFNSSYIYQRYRRDH